MVATGQARLERQTGTTLELYVSCNSGQLDFIRHWYIRVLYFLIDSCHGNKLEHRHFVRRVFFPSSVFSNVLPSRRNNAVSGYIFAVFGYRNAFSGSD